ncbi:MAG: hypothetical protein JOZ81_30140 [Chloroflexi bacterium]|nr:hypothetical protein [Chloroflexota bacterium]
MCAIPAPQVDIWTSIGPTRIDPSGFPATGVLFHIAIPSADPNVIYVSSPTSGVWASADHGATWRDATGNLPSLAVVALAVDPSVPGQLYAAIGDTGVFVSNDGGGSWTGVGAPPSLFPVITDLLVDPTNGRILHVRAQNGIYRSIDGGATWQLSRTGAASNLVMAPQNPNVLYAGVAGQGVARTRDGGASGDAGWSLLTPGLAADATDVRVAVSAADAATVYARLRITSTSNRILGSNDGGATWTQRSSPSVFLSVIAADDTDARRVYTAGVNVFRSDDGGATFSQKDGAHVDHHAIATDPGRASDIYTACDGGLYRSTRADNWTFVANGIGNVEFYDMAVSATRPELVICGTQDNGTVLTDGSKLDWREILGGDGATVAIDPTNAQVMYAMNQFATSIARSGDGGGSFTNIGTGLPTGAACFNLKFGLNPTNPGLLLACCGALWQTPVPSIAWTALFNPPGAPSESVNAFAIGLDNVYYAGTNTGHVYAGPAGTGMQLAFAHPNGATVLDLVADPDDASVLYGVFAAPANPVFRLVRNAGTSIGSVAELSFGHLRALGGSTGGFTAVAIGAGLPKDVTVQTLAVDAMRPFTLFAGTSRGVFRGRSFDQGTTWTWTAYSAGMPPADVRALRVQPSTGLLRAATFGRGAFQVNTDTPVGSLVNTSGRLTFLRAHEVGTGFGRPPNVLDAEVVFLLDSSPSLAFGFQLRADAETPTRRAMLNTLRTAFVQNRPVSIDFVRTAPRIGSVIRVARTV